MNAFHLSMSFALDQFPLCDADPTHTIATARFGLEELLLGDTHGISAIEHVQAVPVS